MMKTTTTKKIRCQCGRVTEVRCSWLGPCAETVVVEIMPEQHRASHEAAGYSGLEGCGRYPLNGAIRVRCSRRCAAMLLEANGGWAREMRGRGQPPRAGTAATRSLRVRLTEDEHARLGRLAERAGVTASEYVRERALGPRFVATHVIQGPSARIYVHAEPGDAGLVLYTEAEWDACDSADWELDPERGLLFQGAVRSGYSWATFANCRWTASDGWAPDGSRTEA
jgi:hypothetical protein